MRRLAVLVRNLPTDSATAFATGTSWTMRDEMTATTVDVLNGLLYLQAKKAMGKKLKAKPPKPLRRPYETAAGSTPAPKLATREEWRARIMGGA